MQQMTQAKWHVDSEIYCVDIRVRNFSVYLTALSSKIVAWQLYMQSEEVYRKPRIGKVLFTLVISLNHCDC